MCSRPSPRMSSLHQWRNVGSQLLDTIHVQYLILRIHMGRPIALVNTPPRWQRLSREAVCENITAPPGTLNLCIDTPADISFQENASKREQAQARTDLAECPILKTLDDEVSVAKRAFSTAERAGLPPEVCTLASSGAVAALNSKSPRHVCDVICKVSALASGISDATLASSHALDSITLGLLDVPLTRSVQTFWVTPGLTTTEIQNDQVVVSKSSILQRKQRQKKVETKQGATLGPETIDATGGATEVWKRQLERKAGGGLFIIAYLTSKKEEEQDEEEGAGVVELQGKICWSVFKITDHNTILVVATNQDQETQDAKFPQVNQGCGAFSFSVALIALRKWSTTNSW